MGRDRAMSQTQLNGRKSTRKGRPLKGGQIRKVVQARMPAPIQEFLAQIADESSLSMSDLGAYYLIQGWNQTRETQGQGAIAMPKYLEDAVHPHLMGLDQPNRTLLDEAEESMLVG